jgi:hypothetical protein
MLPPGGVLYGRIMEGQDKNGFFCGHFSLFRLFVFKPEKQDPPIKSGDDNKGILRDIKEGG